MTKNGLRAKIIALCILSGTLSGCGKKYEPINVATEPIPVEECDNDLLLEDETENELASMQEIITEVVDKGKSLEDIEYTSVVTATDVVNIRNTAGDGKVLGELYTGNSLPTCGKENGFYQVNYNGDLGYVSSDYVIEEETKSLPYDYSKIVYIVEDTPIYINDELTISETLKANEVAEVYDETEDKYLVSTNDYIGYISKTGVQELNGTFVVVDLSDQTLKLYSNNETLIDTLVVTGKPSTPTHEGVFTIQSKRQDTWLQGKWFVNRFMPFDGGIGLHDAEYFTEDNGFNHGWRTSDEFGGETHLTNGSHGCVNMHHDDAIKAYELLNTGDTVIVKQ